MNELVVKQEQRLQRSGARGANWGARGRIGTVENREIRMALDALGHQVNTAPLGVINGLERIVLGKLPLGLRREGMRTGGRRVEAAAERKQRVTDGLGVQTLAWK